MNLSFLETISVLVTFDCPRCLKSDVAEAAASTETLACRHCGWLRAVAPATIQGDVPASCLVCGCEDLWRQKDFPPQVGLAMVGAGILLSTIAVAYMRPVLALGILMGFALVDMVLFALMRDRLVCYRCHAHYRGTGATELHGKFDLELNERYRQETARLKSSNAQESPTTI